MSPEKKQKKIVSLAKRLQLAGDPTRLKVMCVIFERKKVCVSDIAHDLDMSVAAVSHHLRTLAKEGIVRSDREGKRVCYRLFESDFVADLKKFICRHT